MTPIITLMCAVFAIMVAAVIAVSVASSHDHQCNAPCTVILPDNTLEDEFGLDYGWRNSHTPIVDIYVKH